MTTFRYCSTCAATGIGSRGFCHECKGRGDFEVLKQAPEKVNEALLLMLSMVKHTTDEQYTEIVLEFLARLEEHRRPS